MMIKTTNVQLRGDIYRAKQFAELHVNRLLHNFRRLTGRLQINAQRVPFIDTAGNITAEVYMQVVHGAETVVVTTPEYAPPVSEKTAIQPGKIIIDQPDMVLLMPLFEEDYYYSPSFEEFIEYGSLVLEAGFSDPVLWIPQEDGTLVSGRTIPMRYYSSEYEIEEQDRAGDNSEDVRDAFQSSHGDAEYQVYAAVQVVGHDSLPDCWMYIWGEQRDFDPFPGQYNSYAYGVNINDNEITLFAGAHPFTSGSSPQCCEIYNFGGLPVYVFGIGVVPSGGTSADDGELTYGYSLDGLELFTRTYDAIGTLNYRHEIAPELHGTVGTAHGRLRIGRRTRYQPAEVGA